MVKKDFLQYLLAIETSCDETSLALFHKKKLLKCWTWSQIHHFRKFGGVVPQIASGLHMKILPILLENLINEYPAAWSNLKYVAYTRNPGLLGCLRMGEAMAHTIALCKSVKVLGLNHLEGHIYAVTLNHKIIFPALTLVVSGGHTQLGYLAKNLDFKVIGHTVDDAVGEVIDKIARKIGLAYPGGAELEKLAKRGENKYMMKVYENKKDLNFSFSGLKTHAMKLIQQTKKSDFSPTDFACSFQSKIIEVLCKKIQLALQKYPAKCLILGGGVASNFALRKAIEKNCNLRLLVPEKKYCTDNAAMIGALALAKLEKNE